MEKYKPIQYIVQLKENFKMEHTTIKGKFCGRIVLITKDTIFFRLNGSNGLVVVPQDAIKYLAPSDKPWDAGCRIADVPHGDDTMLIHVTVTNEMEKEIENLSKHKNRINTYLLTDDFVERMKRLMEEEHE